jgi:hypothetical protein
VIAALSEREWRNNYVQRIGTKEKAA